MNEISIQNTIQKYQHLESNGLTVYSNGFRGNYYRVSLEIQSPNICILMIKLHCMWCVEGVVIGGPGDQYMTNLRMSAPKKNLL